MSHEIGSPQLGEDVDAGVHDVTTPAVTKKDQLLDRLNKRNKDRQNYFDVKFEQRQKENLQLEGADYFAQSFADRVREIEMRIQNTSEASTTSATPKKEPLSASITAELTRLFADITLEIQELQHYLTSSTIFLTDFKIKACQNVLNELTSSCEEARLCLLPKKKFGFRGKKVVLKPAVSPRVSAGDKVDTPEKTGSSHDAKTVFTWTLSNRSDEYILLQDAEVNGQDVTISNLRNCLVELHGYAGSVQISSAINCTFLFGPIARSLFAEQCRRCTLAVACQQLRLHSSSDCRIYLHVTCRAIIEDCRQIEVGDYNYDYVGIGKDFQHAQLDKTQNNYADVADFNWLSPDVHSPNWQLLKNCADPNWNELCTKFKENHT